MKRFLSLFFVVALAFVLVGCGGSNPEDKYGADEKVEIKEEVTVEDAKEIITSAQQSEITKVTINVKLEGEMSAAGQTVTMTGDMVIIVDVSDEENMKMQMNFTAEGQGEKMQMDIYLTDGYVYSYMSVPEQGEVKYKVALGEADGELAQMNQYMDIASSVLDSLDQVAFDETSFGKDKDGNLVIQSSEELDDEYNDEYRIVIEEGLVKYMYLEMNMGAGMKYKYDYVYNYNKAKFDFPKNLDTYEEMGN